jgi:hypothetical protein
LGSGNVEGNAIQPNGAVSGGGGEVYSTAETVIGTWMGATLYRKCYHVAHLPNNTSITIPHDLNNVRFIRCYGTNLSKGNYNFCSSIPIAFMSGENMIFIRCFANGTSISIQSNADYSTNSGDIIVEYIKL